MGKSKLANTLLAGLKGIEIGGSAQNAFNLDTINVDRRRPDQFYIKHQAQHGAVMPVDVEVESGDKLPFLDKSFDFVISSHVIEHFYDPIKALLEWVRVARRYVYVIAPHVDRTFDKGRAVTTLDELLARNRGENVDPAHREDRHWSVWRTADFVKIVRHLKLPIAAVQEVDDKVGNGFAVVIGDLKHHSDKTP